MPENGLYTVTELARDLGVTARAIRFYEDKGLITPRRAGVTRVFTPRDRARMVLILRGKRLGLSLSDIKGYLDLYGVDAAQRAQLPLLIECVSRHRSQLAAQRQAIDDALAELEDIEARAKAALNAPAAPRRRAAG